MIEEALTLIGVGTAFFLVVMGYMNVVLKAQRGLTYRDRPQRFCWLYIGAIALLLVLFGQTHHYLTLQAVMLIAGAGTLYISFTISWQKWCPSGDYRQCFGVPTAHEYMLHMNVGYGVTKMFEIVFQQLCALIVIEGLFLLESSALSVSLFFATVVGVAHLPGVRWFGRLFGWFFAISSTVLALIYPLLISSESGGVGVMVLLHVLTYILWYTFLLSRLPAAA